jgi:peroxiredoxin Q/BCP
MPKAPARAPKKVAKKPAKRLTRKATNKTAAKPAKKASSKAVANVASKAPPKPMAKAPAGPSTQPAGMLGIGARPQQSLPFVDSTGAAHTLASFAGQHVLVTFFVKPSTPACTTQVCELAAFVAGSHADVPLPESVQRAGLVVLAVGPGTQATHATFAKTVAQSIPRAADKAAGKPARTSRSLLIVDAAPAGEAPPIARAFGAWGEKQMYGKSYMGVLRSSFLLGPDGTVRQVWPSVRAKEHTAEVAAWIAANA